jgi:hypothetical protein
MKKFLAAASAAGRCSTARVHISAIVVLHIIISVTAVPRGGRRARARVVLHITSFRIAGQPARADNTY